MLLFTDVSGDGEMLQSGMLAIADIAGHWLFREKRNLHEILELAAQLGFRAVSKR